MKILKSAVILLLLVITAVFLFPSCNNGKVIPEEKFIRLYTDIVIAQDTTAEAYNGMVKIRTEVLKRFNVTEKEYNSTLDYYNAKPERWELFFDKVIFYVEELKQKAAKKP
ncbi:MAG: DUF4296 domain-containing protein [Ignavibacteriaceae bacterium]|nr:DUF4296 domain-containing protein [Ignavibacteriaceae bacterium]